MKRIYFYIIFVFSSLCLGQEKTNIEKEIIELKERISILEKKINFKTNNTLPIHIGGLFKGLIYVPKDRNNRKSEIRMQKTRLEFEMEFSNGFDLLVEPNFKNGENISVEEAWVGWHPLKSFYGNDNEHPYLHLRVGRIKVPISYEILIPTKHLDFPDLSPASYLAPDEDLGVMVDFWPLQDILLLQPALVNGTAGREKDSSKDIVLRTEIHPFGKDKSYNFHLGFSYSNGNERYDISGDELETGFMEPWFEYSSNTYMTGKRQRFAGETSFAYGPFGLYADFIFVSHGLKNSYSKRKVRPKGGHIGVSYYLTGEAKKWKGIDVLNPLGKGGFGAIQLAGRISFVSLGREYQNFSSQDNSTRGLTELDFGINWIPVYNAVFQAHVFLNKYRGKLKNDKVFLLQFLLRF